MMNLDITDRSISAETTTSKKIIPDMTRRRFVLGTTSALALSALPLPSMSATPSASLNQTPVLTGTEFDLHIGYQSVNFTGRDRMATTVNNSFPAPTLRWKEGDDIRIRVTNH